MKKFALVAAMICLGFTGCDNKGTTSGGTGTAGKAATSPGTAAATPPATVAPTGPGGTAAK